MALSLDQIGKQKKSAPERPDQTPKKQLLRPWQNFDSLGIQTRTVAAKEAVQRAKQVVVAPAYRPITRPVCAISPQEIGTTIHAGGLFDFLNYLF